VNMSHNAERLMGCVFYTVYKLFNYELFFEKSVRVISVRVNSGPMRTKILSNSFGG